MILILASIIFTSGLLIAFRWMSNIDANHRHAIMINYGLAALASFIYFRPSIDIFTSTWFWPGMVLGVFFYIVFRIVGITTRVNGLTAASITTKMSVIIPICFGLLLLDEKITALKIAGIVIGFIAVLMSNGKMEVHGSLKWIIAAFLGSGLVDASLKIFQYWFDDFDFGGFSTAIFSSAFVISLLHHQILPDKELSSKSIISGIALGLINVLSLIFVLNTLALPDWDSSVIYPLINFGVVVFSALIAKLAFKEHFESKKIFGLMLALVSIVMLLYA